jgi:hypothetical protein
MSARDTNRKSTKLYGRHSLTFEPPDTVFFVGIGALDGPTATTMMEQWIAWARELRYVLVLVDVVKLSSVSGEARKIITSNGHRLPPRAISVFGGSFATQVLIGLLDRACTLLGSKDRIVKHWPDEKSARAWAAQMRPLLLANAGDRKGSV